MNRSLATGLVLLMATIATAETASAPQGVTLEVPTGFRWAKGQQPRSTTIIYLLEAAPPAGATPATIQVDHIAPVSATEAELFNQMRQAIGEVSPDDHASEEVVLPSGRYLRADFDLEVGDPPRLLRKRYYMTLRDGHVFQLILSAEKPRFEALLAGFDAMVGGTTLSEPTPVAATGPSPTPAATPRPSPSQAPNPTPTATARPAPSASPTPSASPRPTPSATPRPTPAATPRPTPSATPRPTPAATPRPTPSATPRPTPSATPRPTPSATPSATPRPTSSAAPTQPQPASRPTPSPQPQIQPSPASSDGNLLAGASVVLVSSEYDPDYWAARHLLDARSDRGWCSSPGSRAPHRVVLALAQPARVTRVDLDNTCPAEPGFEGVETKRFKIEASALGPERGYRQIAAGELQAGKDQQSFPADSGVAVRWLRLTILSNHGHPTLTELMELRAFGDAALGASGAASGEAFRLERARTSKEKNGEALEGLFSAGQRVWINFKPRSLSTDPEGKYWLEVDLVLEDDTGNVLLRRDKVVDRMARVPTPPLSTFVSLHLDLPEGFPAGAYTVRLLARDRFGERSAAAACEFKVGD